MKQPARDEYCAYALTPARSSCAEDSVSMQRLALGKRLMMLGAIDMDQYEHYIQDDKFELADADAIVATLRAYGELGK